MDNNNNNKKSLITVAIPFFNAERFLSQAIDSVFSQTYKNWKLILIDDGSTDKSLSIAQKYCTDDRVSIHSDGLNKNLGYRLNQIPTLVDTEYLARMDADDIMHPQKLEKQMHFLLSHPETDVLGTNAFSIDENNFIQGIRYKNIGNRSVVNVNGFIHPTVIAKTKWFLENPYDVKAERIEDAELWHRTQHNSHFVMLTEPLFYYREFGDNYYKKYFKGFNAVLYILNKYSYNPKMIKFASKYYISGIRYYLYNIFGKESILVKNRNGIVFKNPTKLVS